MVPNNEVTMRRSRFSISILVVAGFVAAMSCSAQGMNSPAAPCQSPMSGMDSSNCFHAAAQKADKELNLTYSQIRAALKNRGGDDDLQNLVNAQRLWLQFRDASCKAEHALYEGGSAAPEVYDACIEEKTRLRTVDLKTAYGWVVEKFGDTAQNGGK
jgi:uncharacterized protein YecT (DUF1311 family)